MNASNTLRYGLRLTLTVNQHDHRLAGLNIHGNDWTAPSLTATASYGWTRVRLSIDHALFLGDRVTYGERPRRKSSACGRLGVENEYHKRSG